MTHNNKQKKQKVFVGMSGGVDSSVAALLLKRAGYDVTGVFMRCYNLDGCAERDATDARRVAEHLEIPFYVFDFEEEYKRAVVSYMVEGYRNGLTPNPDVECNREIKFGLFLKKALELGADYVATGHYVRRLLLSRRRSSTRSSGESRPALSPRQSTKGGTNLVEATRAAAQKELGEWGLFEGMDKGKDQSYFLWTLTQDQLRHCLFPIGEYKKSKVRAIARRAGLVVAEKKDSQGICFLGKVTLSDFLKSYIPERSGAVLNTSGVKVGEHEGAYFYTIGQRHLGAESKVKISHRGVDTKPAYVAEKNITTNTLVVAEGNNNPALYKKEITLTDLNFINPKIHNSLFEIPLLARVRYRQPLSKAILSYKSLVKSYKLTFETAQKFVAPGQSAVFYGKNGEMLGGGVIQ